MTQKMGTTLREAALSAYDRLSFERFMERKRYEGMALGDAVLLKLAKVFGSGYEVRIIAGGSEYELFAEVDGLRFLGVRLPDGDVRVVWIAKCTRCGEEEGVRFLNSLTDLGEELSEFNRTGRPAGHRCQDDAAEPAGAARRS